MTPSPIEDAFIALRGLNASCCRYHLLPQGDLCASCPLVPQERRLELNLEWMKTQLERRAKAAGHG